jgi:hypothetical protein
MSSRKRTIEVNAVGEPSATRIVSRDGTEIAHWTRFGASMLAFHPAGFRAMARESAKDLRDASEEFNRQSETSSATAAEWKRGFTRPCGNRAVRRSVSPPPVWAGLVAALYMPALAGGRVRFPLPTGRALDSCTDGHGVSSGTREAS